MNKYITILIVSVLLSSCQKEEGCMDPTALNYNNTAMIDDGSCNYAPLNLMIFFTQTVDGNPLAVNQMIYNNQSNQLFSIQTLRYLISDITLYEANGNSTIVDDVHFIDISIDSTLSLYIPEIDNVNYTSLSFTMGLDSIKNKSNNYLNENFFPSFAWPEFLGGGYHYMQLEGDFNTVFNGYATHTGPTNGIDFSFNMNFTLNINKANSNIFINMEISNWYQNPETYILTSNGIMGDANSQIILQANGIDDVFSVYTTDL